MDVRMHGFFSSPDIGGGPPNPQDATLHQARSQLHEVLALQTGIHSLQSVPVCPGHNLKHEDDSAPTFLQRSSEKGGGSTFRWYHICGSRLLSTRGCNLSCFHNDEHCFQQELHTPGFHVRYCSYFIAVLVVDLWMLWTWWPPQERSRHQTMNKFIFPLRSQLDLCAEISLFA